MASNTALYFKGQEIDIFHQLHSDIVKYSATGQIIIIDDLNSVLGSLLTPETFSKINDNPDEQHDSIDNIDSLPVLCFIDTNSNQSGKKLLELLSESSMATLQVNLHAISTMVVAD